MDRFEVFSQDGSDFLVFIYIPVWIDLKGICARRRVALFIDLHSSMDRFEVKLNKSSSFVFSHLHSSMDRFEGNKYY